MPSLERVTVPPQDRLRTDHQHEPPQLLPRQMVKQTGKDDAVGIGERGLADLALQHQQLMPQRQDLEVFVPVAHRQQAQQRDRSSCRPYPVLCR